MTDSYYKVRVEVDGIIYRGRHSVHQTGDRVYIDGRLVGVEVDNDGNPLAAPLPVARASADRGSRGCCGCGRDLTTPPSYHVELAQPSFPSECSATLPELCLQVIHPGEARRLRLRVILQPGRSPAPLQLHQKATPVHAP